MWKLLTCYARYLLNPFLTSIIYEGSLRVQNKNKQDLVFIELAHDILFTNKDF